MVGPETPYTREPGYAERYRDRRFTHGSGRRTDRLEVRAIQSLLAKAKQSIDLQGHWLDAPSGAGRLSELLPGTPIRSDRNLTMLQACDRGMPRICASVHQLPFTDQVFAGVLCMRLLHHIPQSSERRRILSEFRRVSRGPVILSFFHSISLQHARRKIARQLGKTRSGRCAIRFSVLREDLAAAGLEVVATRPLLRFISEQWLVLARPR